MVDEKIINKEVIETVIQNFFAKEILTEEDLKLSKEDFFKKILTILQHIEIGIITDYRSNILNQAELFFQNKQYEFSKVFFAMFFEHSLNSLIENECHRRKINDKIKNDIIKSTDIYGKLTWLPTLLGFREFNSTHLKTIKQLSDDRNAFIHYKWKPDDLNEETKESEIEKEFKKIKLAVRYMKLYETNLFYRKNKKKLSLKYK